MSSNGFEELELVLFAVVLSETLVKIVADIRPILRVKIVHHRPAQVHYDGIPA